MQLAELAAEAYKKAGNMRELARALGVGLQTVHRWTNGKTTPPRRYEDTLRAYLGMELVSAGKRFCGDCGSWRSVDEFAPYKNGYFSAFCRVHATRRLVDFQRRKGYGAKYGLKRGLRVYGLTVADYNAMRAAQQNRCAICRRHESEIKSNAKHPERKLYVDHCHRSGKVRALLCSRCNAIVGIFEVKPALVEAITAYVRRHKEEIDGGDGRKV